MVMKDYLETSLRVWTERLEEPRPRSKASRDSRPFRPEFLLVLDTETTTDAAQRLVFGSYRYYRVTWHESAPALTCVEEGLFCADDLGRLDREGFRHLKRYARTHRAATAAGMAPELKLLSRQQFVDTVLYQEAFKKRSLIVGFNLPFDLSRLAIGYGEARGRFYGGVSLRLWDYQARDGTRKENRFRPRIAIKQIDSKRALKGFTRPATLDDIDRIPEVAEDGRLADGYMFRGHFLDLRTLVFSLTDKGHSLGSACQAYGIANGKLSTEGHGRITPSYIDYNRRDVEVTAELFARVMKDYGQHPIDLQSTRAYSPASIGKAYLRAMGIVPRLQRQPDFPSEVLGYAMVGYYGGRAECRIRKVPVPVVYLDFLSMYPTVNALMGLWRFHVADRVDIEDRTEETRKLLERITLGDCFRRETWHEFAVLVEVEPKGDILPVRARYDPATPSWQIGLNHLETDRRWYALPDLVAAKLLSGRAPRIRRALALVPSEPQPNLQGVRLRGEVRIDPAPNDLFKVAIEERKRLASRADLGTEEGSRLDRFLKVLANATSYGITAEMNRRELPKGRTERTRAYGVAPPFELKVPAPEDAGEFCFPPLASTITSGARLMLAMLERTITDLEGTYAICDTDSMAVVATEHGGLVPCRGGPFVGPKGGESVRALTWEQVEEIRSRFGCLNPYDQQAVPGSILKLEKENLDPQTRQRRQLWCHAISAKRYALFNLDHSGAPVLRKWSEHGLGHLLNPTDPDSEDRDWIRLLWAILVREALGLSVEHPAWIDRPAISRITASSPHLLRPFAGLNDGRPYIDEVKPFNFLLSAHVAPFGHPEGIDPTRFHLVAPWSSDPREWLERSWFDVHSGRQFQLTTIDDFGASDRVLVKTYGDVLAVYRMHPEAKSHGAA
jgi:hypothetical protein